MDGTLIQTWTSQKSFRANDGSDEDDEGRHDFSGQKPSNDISVNHRSERPAPQEELWQAVRLSY